MIFLAAVLLFCASAAQPTSRQSEVTVAHSLDYRPFCYVDTAGVSRGILIDFWELWSKKTGIKVTFVPAPWGECLRQVSEGEVDILGGAFYTPQRDSVLDFSQTILDIETVVMERRSLNLSDLDDLAGRVVAVTSGDKAGDYLRRLAPMLKLKEYDGFEGPARAAAEGKVDAFAMDRPSAVYYLTKYGAQDEFQPLRTLYVGRLCAAVAEGRLELLAKVDDGIAEIRREEIGGIIDRWVPAAGPPPAHLLKWLLISLVAIVVALILAHTVIMQLRVRRQKLELDAAREKYRLLFENVPQGIGVSREGRYIFVNPSMSRMSGYSEQELTSCPKVDFVHPLDTGKIETMAARRAQGERPPVSYDLRIMKADGGLLWLQFNWVDIEWEGRPAQLEFITDITEMKAAEDAVKKAEQQLRGIVEVSPVPLIVTRVEDGRILYVNDNLARLIGYEKEDMLGQLSPDFYYNLEDRRRLLENLNRNGRVDNYEVRLKRPGGEPLWTIFSLALAEIGGEKVIMGGLYDITERKVMEDALKKERNFVSAVLDTAGALVAVLDLDGRIIRFNKACVRMSGFRFDEVVGRPIWDTVIPPDEIAMIRDRFQTVVDVDSVVTGENHWLTKDGDLRLIEWSNAVLRDDDGSPEYVVAIGIDITEKRRAEEKLRLYREIYLNSRDGITVVDADGRFLESNPAHKRLSGRSEEELKGQAVDNLLPGGETTDALESLRRTGGFRTQRSVQAAGGEDRTIDINMFSIKDDHGRVEFYAGIGRDITDQKKARDSLALRLRYEEGLALCSRALLEKRSTRRTLDEALQGLLEASQTCRAYIFENFEDEAEGLCMRMTHEVCDETVSPEISNPLLQQLPYRRGFQHWQEKLSAGEPVKGALGDLPKDGLQVAIQPNLKSFLALPLMIDGRWCGIVGFDDCAEERVWSDEDIRLLRTGSEMIGAYLGQLRSEEALQFSEERFRRIVENAKDVIYSLTPDGRFSYLAPQFTQLTGYDTSDFVGHPVYKAVMPEKTELVRTWIEKGMPDDDSPLDESLFELKAKDGRTCWFLVSTSVIRDAEGKPIEAIGIAHDITEMKQLVDDLETANRHLKETQTQLVQSEKMASLGMLVAGVAHEINTPLGAISSMHDTLMRSLNKLKTTIDRADLQNEETARDLQRYLATVDNANQVIASGSERVTNIVRRLRSFARLDEAELLEADIHDGLEDTLTLIHHEIKHNIEVVRDYGDLPRINCYPGQLNQVFLNILINAKQAISGRGEIKISTRAVDGRVRISISDNGRGMPPEVKAKIFDPGFTTKGVGVGTGLGLSICYQIIQHHRGRIAVDSELGRGTTFTIELPTDIHEEA